MKFLSVILFISLLTVSAHGQSPSNAKQTPVIENAMASSGSVAVLVGAGDIASCDDLAGAQATAKLLDNIPGTVFAAGDLVYPDGSDARCGSHFDGADVFRRVRDMILHEEGRNAGFWPWHQQMVAGVRFELTTFGL